jgi:hypothetical protein
MEAVNKRTHKGATAESQLLTFLAGGTGGGAIAPEMSPLVSSASESDVILPHDMSAIPV